MRKISYAQGINEALFQLMENNKNVFLMGQGVATPWCVGDTTRDLIDRFGPKRVIDTPVSENGITGIAAGASLAGMRPILAHTRMDFMYYAMDQIANHIANWRAMSGGRMNMPLVIWGIINRGGSQAAQHSQALQAIFAHLPGLKVVMPSSPYDAKGLLISALEDNNPVLYIDDRWLYKFKGNVPKKRYKVPLGKGKIIKKGRNITIVAASYMVLEAIKAIEELDKKSVDDVELIDLRSLRPLDEDLVLSSVKKTGRLIVVDGGWKSYGITAEISALVSENIFESLKSPILRVALPDAPAPASPFLEEAYYPKAKDIISAVRKVLKNAI